MIDTDVSGEVLARLRRDVERGLAELTARDVVLSGLLERLGPPPAWWRPPGFETLTHVVLEQQVSLSSARAALERLRAAAGEVTPEAVLALGEDGVRAAGVTRQKASYVLGVARAVMSGELPLDRLGDLPDEEARAALTGLRGVGAWTADVYLLIALGRPDVFPVGDLGLVLAVRDAYGLPGKPSAAELLERGEGWRPWRGVATRLLWHLYLTQRGRSMPV
ncbi:DNA-3-methyladenine glycosylase family protein [Deinococcus pimensis]|uniref:DNA-3-methyladenine glycosylase family protein n=1 Tax=Deinococcus pimensis TaxID=309888 RepID=UPI0004B15F6D|nr:DNA-3-methyladenine glycosylase [Deinococcus pimensis]